MGQQYESLHKDYCNKAYEYLSSAFSFTYSPEGYEFWNAVNQRLYSLARGKNSDTPIAVSPLGMRELIAAESKRIQARLDLLQAEIDSQAQTIVELRRKLLIADFCNMGR